jgi:hypothetical protein
MPKQIIIEYPYKAIFDKNKYFVYHYDVLDESIMIIKSDKSYFDYPDKYYDFKILSPLIEQCQTELNNQ